MRRTNNRRSRQNNTNKSVQRALVQSNKRNHGFIRSHTRYDPPQYKTIVSFQFKRRVIRTLADNSFVEISLSDILPAGVVSIKIPIIQAWNTTGNLIKLRYLEREAGGSSEYQYADDMETSDYGGKNHFPAASLCPPQDDWLNVGGTTAAYVSVGGEGDVIVDISIHARYLLPIYDANPEVRRDSTRGPVLDLNLNKLAI